MELGLSLRLSVPLPDCPLVDAGGAAWGALGEAPLAPDVEPGPCAPARPVVITSAAAAADAKSVFFMELPPHIPADRQRQGKSGVPEKYRDEREIFVRDVNTRSSRPANGH